MPLADAPGTTCLPGAANLPTAAHPTGVRFVDVGKPDLDECGDPVGLPPTATTTQSRPAKSPSP